MIVRVAFELSRIRLLEAQAGTFQLHQSNAKGQPAAEERIFPISGGLREYLGHYKREMELPVKYENLLQSVDSYP